MRKKNIVQYSRDFDKIIKNGRFVKNKEFVIYYINNNLDDYRFGISVSKKIGNAVCRNYYKRIIRNIIDNNKKCLKNLDYIVITRKACTFIKYNDIEKSIVYLLEKVEKEIL